MPQVVNMKVLHGRCLGRVSEYVRHIAGGPRPPIRLGEHVAVTLEVEGPQDRHGLVAPGDPTVSISYTPLSISSWICFAAKISLGFNPTVRISDTFNPICKYLYLFAFKENSSITMSTFLTLLRQIASEHCINTTKYILKKSHT